MEGGRAWWDGGCYTRRDRRRRRIVLRTGGLRKLALRITRPGTVDLACRIMLPNMDAIGVPTPLLHGEDDQIVPIHASAWLATPPLQQDTLMTSPTMAC